MGRPGAAVFTFRDGNVVNLVLTDPDGLKAAGLEE
jgi:hypothetical protein